MKKAKIKNNLITVLGAVLSVIFACIVGITYSVSSLDLKYGINPVSTSAYLSNQQYHIINDTIANPINFGTGSHNFEIGMQYSFPYDVDMCFKYALTWSKKTGETETINTDNVILNFSNRDNIILDTQNVYLANAIPAGSSKVIFINGVEFVDVNDSFYFGRTLTITISDVKIYKKQNTYTTDHLLYSDCLAGKTWYDYKNCSTSDDTKVLMYNYRRDYQHGMPFVGLQTAYKQTVKTNEGGTELSRSATWLGGNKGYAGIGMYLVTGKNPIKLTAQVEGIWYDKSGEEIKDSELISENSIRFNYAKGWTHKEWYNNKMWERRTYDYIIPKETACYINILDSVEITSVSKSPTNIEYDKYRLATSEITISAGGTDLSFEYSKTAGTNYIQNKDLKVDTTLTSAGTYSQDSVSVVNTSLYSAGLFTTKFDNSAQTFRTSISLVNNTKYIQSVTVNYSLYYYKSNGYTGLKSSSTGLRADEYVSQQGWSQEQAFVESSLYYSYAKKSSSSFKISSSDVRQETIVIGAYSSVNLVGSYEVAKGLQDEVLITADSTTKNYFDVWTYLNVTTSSVQVNPDSNPDNNPASLNFQIESTLNSNNQMVFSVKNNSNKTVEGVSINKFSVNALEVETYKALSSKPDDWGTYFWKYYRKDGDDFIALQTDPFASNTGSVSITNYYEKIQTYSSVSYNLKEGFSVSNNSIVNSNKTLKPGEVVEFAETVAVATNTHYLTFALEGVASTMATSTITTSTGALLINDGKENAFIFNASSNESYYITFFGTLKSSVANIESETVTVDVGGVPTSMRKNYYIGILRPGQIISVPMSSGGTLDSTDVLAKFSKSDLTNDGWSSTMAGKMESLFNINKTS